MSLLVTTVASATVFDLVASAYFVQVLTKCPWCTATVSWPVYKWDATLHPWGTTPSQLLKKRSFNNWDGVVLQGCNVAPRF